MKRMRYYQIALACLLGMVLFIPCTWAAQTISVSGKSPLAGANVVFQPYSIDRVYPGGVVQTLLFPTGPGQANVQNCYVDAATGFDVTNVAVVGSNDTTIVYRIDAVSPAILNLYTKTRSTDIAYQEQTSVTWCDYLHFTFDTSWPVTPMNTYTLKNGPQAGTKVVIDPCNYVGLFGAQAAFHYMDTKLKPVVLPSGAKVTPNINSELNEGIDDYRNLVMRVGYNNPGPVEFKAESDETVRINFETTSWQVTNLKAMDDYEVTSLGQYQVDYANVGKDGGRLTVMSYTQQLAEQNAFMTDVEKQNFALANAASKIGWSNQGMQYGVTIQQGQQDGPTALNSLVTAGNRAPANNTVLNVNLGYRISPNIKRDMQLYSVTHGQIAFQDNNYLFWGAGIKYLNPGTTTQEKQTTWVEANNRVIRQEWEIGFSFYVTVVPEHISTTAILGMPKMVQDNMVIDASVGGQTDLTAYVNDADPLGGFVRTLGDVFDQVIQWIVTILIIGVIALAVIYLVPGLFKKIGGKK